MGLHLGDESGRLRVLGPVGAGNFSTARHIARILDAVAHVFDATAVYVVFPTDPWSLVYASFEPADPPLASLERIFAEATSAHDESETLVTVDIADLRYVRRIAFPLAIGSRPCALVAFGPEAFAPNAAHCFVVRTLLDDLAALSRANNDSALSHVVAVADRMRLLESVVDHAADAVLIADIGDGRGEGPRTLYVNAAFTRMTGYTLADMLGKSPRLLQGPGTDRAVIGMVRTAIETQTAISVEIRNYRKDGSDYLAELSVVPVANERGIFTHWVSVQRDVTERHAVIEIAQRAERAEEQRAALEAAMHERGRFEEKLAHSAYHDDLTGLPNRALFTLRLDGALATLQNAEDSGLGLLFMDLDRFKHVNDTLGHHVGDLLLIDVAGRLRKCLRDGDVLARLGGDEFTMLVDGPLSTSVMVAERVLQVLDQTFSVDGHSITTSPSIGIAHTQSGDHVSGDLMRDADTAMYRAKLERGGSCFEIFDGTMHATAVARLQRELDLPRALATGQFIVEYQPIVDIAEGTVEGVEALVRWCHPQEGLLLPGHFVPLAEATGDIAAIGAFVFEKACQDMAARALRGCPPMRVGINVSSRELSEPDVYIANVERVLAETGLDPASVQLEITEGILLTRFAQTRTLLKRVRKTGCRVAFDDFGTGYSNLGHLVRYPVDTLKIDRSFMNDIGETGVQRDHVRTIVSLARSLELGVVAEGIETRDQAHVLRRLGCTLQQGLLYGAPVPASELDATIARIRTTMGSILTRDAQGLAAGPDPQGARIS